MFLRLEIIRDDGVPMCADIVHPISLPCLETEVNFTPSLKTEDGQLVLSGITLRANVRSAQDCPDESFFQPDAVR